MSVNMPEALFKPNLDDIHRHLVRLFSRCLEEYPDGKIQIDCGDPEKKQPWRSEYFPIKELRKAVEFAAEQNIAGLNIYVGVNPRTPDTPPMGSATNDDIEISFFNFADCDTETSTQLLKRKNPLEYSFAVTTGRTPSPRVHPYWELEEPTWNLVAWSSIQAGLRDKFQGDAVIDPRRIMRLAGTVNYPAAHKVGRGYQVELVTLRTEYDGEQREPVPVQDLHQAFPVAAPAEQAPQASETDPLGLGVSDRLDVIGAGQALINGEGEWHNTMIKLVLHWINRGWSDAEILMAATSWTQPGYTHEQTYQEVRKAIKGGRDKAGQANPEHRLDGEASLGDTGEDDEGPIQASTLVGDPPDREWLAEEWIPLNTISSLYGDGGIGKSLLAQQLATAATIGGTWLGIKIPKTKTLCVFCEDDRNELWRRQVDINNATGVSMPAAMLEDLYLWPRVGSDNLLVTFDLAGVPAPSPLVETIIGKIRENDIKFIVLDTVADTFGGNENNRTQVNFFVKAVVGRIRKETGVTILLLAHPSLSGLASGKGTGGSTAWNNAVRSRLYLSKPDEGLDGERTLTRMKSNYSQSGDGTLVRLFWEKGAFQHSDVIGTDTVARIEVGTCKKKILEAVKAAWDGGTPFKARSDTGRKLETCIKDLLGKDHPQAVIAQALRELKEDDEIIKNDRKPIRGWRVAEDE